VKIVTLPGARALTVELIPHCTSVVRDGWTGSHDVRPLAELGMRQAEALVAAIGGDVDGVYSSPTVRCRQTVGPLAASVGLPVTDLAELYEAGDFGEPAAGVDEIPDLMVRALGGAWAAGRMLRAVALLMDEHPGGRVVAASHGDTIPVLLAALASAAGMARSRHVGRGGWYTLRFAPGDLLITSHDPVPLDGSVPPRPRPSAGHDGAGPA
jgi:8-oxo-dGTP diphosphatase